ncbi:MAG: glycoside hydrolase family 15 protein [Pseudorhodoplanes sp.]|uniref:glycoside hydrolase family 15 protein n=1 Tax=Pseudorhodoplanes sp. TaxID=1934341 RepID=UPI003D12BE16
MKTLRIEDYALIGDCETAALVGRDGSIDWLCWPRFDSDACFAALLGTPENGCFRIAPVDEAQVTRRYRDNTLILETSFETKDGAATVIDFMPVRTGASDASDLVRVVRGDRGTVTMSAELTLRFGYGSVIPWVVRLDRETLRAIAGPDMVLLRSPVELQGKGFKTVGEFNIAAGETIPFTLVHSQSHLPLPPAIDPAEALIATERFWQNWVAPARGGGRFAGLIHRSLITLKALTYAPTGGIVAAPTTSLPELIGGERNWDYRFCWLRDSTLALLALMNAGFYEEAEAWRDWLLRAVAGSPDQIQIMYGIAGERRLTEWEVPWLPGYRNARPVRIGNGAHQQLQLDVYGELFDSLHQGRAGGLSQSEAGWNLQLALLAHLERAWREPDEGIWEVRSQRQHFTHSKVMAWVAFDRAVKDVERFGLPGPAGRWRRICGDIRADVLTNGFDTELNTFVRSYGTRELDASLLLLAEVGFLAADDPRFAGTVRQIEKRLLRDGLVYRYDTLVSEDGLPPGEGAFLACSFWLADAYVLMGRRTDAERLFERLVALCNDVGLLSEQYDPAGGMQLGNFPQAFSHIALVNTAFNLSAYSKPAEQRAERAPDQEKA